MLLGAMDRIVRASGRRDVQCLIIGDGPEHANLIALSESLGLGDYVTFSGYLSGGALLTHLSSIDVGAIPDPPNAFNDKVSINKVFEYMALGIPFVQFDLSESASAAGEAALAARDDTPAGLADAILELLDDPARRAAMGAYGMARARRDFRWDTEEAKLLAAYEALLG